MARNVLIFPGGTEIGLEIYQALRLCKEVVLHSASQQVSNHAPFLYQSYHILPSINEPTWLDELVKLCRDLGIEYIFPAYDDVLVELAKHRDEIPAVILTASRSVCRTTRSKSRTYDQLSSIVRVPRIYKYTEKKDFPLFVKPDRGQGSQGAQLVQNETELALVTSALKDPIVCEYLPGEEYTVDCLSDRDHGVIFCGARIRLRVRNGIAVNTKSIKLDGSEEIANHIHQELGMRGAWFFQLKRAEDGHLVLLEVAPRIAGSMSVHRMQGINFPLMTIFEHERRNLKKITLQSPKELDRALSNRYLLNIKYNKLYIDLDDTLILRNQVNIDALALVFNCINRNIPVTLITRHDGNLNITLKKFKLNGLFDEILHLDLVQPKSDYILESEAIFVDDSFKERWDVHQRRGIPTFDCSMLDALIQSR